MLVWNDFVVCQSWCLEGGYQLTIITSDMCLSWEGRCFNCRDYFVISSRHSALNMCTLLQPWNISGLDLRRARSSPAWFVSGFLRANCENGPAALIWMCADLRSDEVGDVLQVGCRDWPHTPEVHQGSSM